MRASITQIVELPSPDLNAGEEEFARWLLMVTWVVHRLGQSLVAEKNFGQCIYPNSSITQVFAGSSLSPASQSQTVA